MMAMILIIFQCMDKILKLYKTQLKVLYNAQNTNIKYPKFPTCDYYSVLGYRTNT